MPVGACFDDFAGLLAWSQGDGAARDRLAPFVEREVEVNDSSREAGR